MFASLSPSLLKWISYSATHTSTPPNANATRAHSLSTKSLLFIHQLASDLSRAGPRIGIRTPAKMKSIPMTDTKIGGTSASCCKEKEDANDYS